MDPEFVKKYESELKCPWYVFNESGEVHTIKYKQNQYKPVLTEGWNELTNFHHMPNNVEVVFGYYGNNYFRIEMFKDVTTSTELPKFHSRSSMRFETVHFHCQVWDDQLQSELFVMTILLLLYYIYISVNSTTQISLISSFSAIIQ